MSRARLLSMLAAALLWSCSEAEDDAVDPDAPDAPPGVDAGAPRSAPPDIVLATEELELAEPLDRPAALAFVPGSDDELLVLEQRSRIAHYRLVDDGAELIGSFEAPEVFDGRDCGLIALAFDPEFQDNGLLYLSICLSQQSSGVFRFHFDPEDYAATAASMTEIIVVSESRSEYGIHNIGSIGFDPDGHLWALFGDKTWGDNGHKRDNNLGAVVRVVPNREPEGSGYEPAPDNPYEENPDLYAHGFRSPWRGVMDRFGRLWVGDVGADSVEEINLVVPGGYHGWPDHEGPCRGECEGRVNPIVSWEQEDDAPYVLDDLDAAATTRRVGWLADFYDPQRSDADPYAGVLDDRLLFGDMCSGFLRVLEVDGAGEIVHDVHVGHLRYMTGVAQAPDGHFYVTTYGSCGAGKGTHPAGKLLRIIAAE
ncbi:MAG: PQQ-dependent sugar dehydrogenase [Myxococcales bacterium]|nr:PQQ-dependent sugar dehydrogenase [Myxococcales bacterium]